MAWALLGSTQSRASIFGYNTSGYLGPGFETTGAQQTLAIYGITGSYVFPQDIELGIELAMRGAIPTVGLDLNLFFNDIFFVGIQMGLDFPEHITYYLGPQMGFDWNIDRQLSIGPELQYLYTVHDRGGIFEALFSLKYYFSGPTTTARPSK
jgi:hypothetical protein